MRNANKDFMIECMQDVEAALTLSGDLRGRLRPPNDIVTVSVYAWTCKILGVGALLRLLDLSYLLLSFS